MKVNRKPLALLLSLLLFTIVVSHVSSDHAKFNASHSVALPSEAILDARSLPLFSSGGKYGFISSVTTGALLSFSATTGKMLSSVVVGETAGAISMVEANDRRLVAVPTANDPTNDRPATVTIVDATKPKNLEIIALTIFPKEAQFTPATRALLTPDGRFGIIASSLNEPTLYSFSAETGQLISQIAIGGQPSEIAMHNAAAKSLVAVASAAANSVSLLSLDDAGNLTKLSEFSPADGRFGEANNPAFSADGRIAYIAAAQGERLFAIDVLSGKSISSLPVAPAPERITSARNRHREELIAVTRSGSGGVLIASSQRGQLLTKAVFEPPQPIEFAEANNVVFSDDGDIAFIAAKSGMLFAFSPESGEIQSFQQLGSELMSITLNSNARKIAAVRRTASRDEIVIADFDVIGGDPEKSPVKETLLRQEEANAIEEMVTAPGVVPNSAKPSAEVYRGALNGLKLVETGANQSVATAKPVITAIDANGNYRVVLSNANGKQLAIEPSRVRLRSATTLEIDLEGKLNELARQNGWKFQIKQANTEKPIIEKSIATKPELSRAFLKRAKNEDGMMRLKLTGANLTAGATIEIVKAGAVVDRQPLTAVDNEGATLRMPESKVLALGLFQVRVVSAGKVASNLLEVEPFKKPLTAEADTRLVNPVNTYTLKAAATIGSVSARTVAGGVEVIVNANAQSQYTAFKLSRPARIVVDVMGVKSTQTGKVLALRSPSISRVRLGQPAAGVMRVVLDANGAVPYNVKRQGNQLIITAGNTGIAAR